MSTFESKNLVIVDASAETLAHSDSGRDPLAELNAHVKEYLTPEQINEIQRAYRFGAEAHTGQLRLSGEPYISHPLAAATILAEMRLDYETIMAAILHDVIEDTAITKEQLAEAFGQEIADLVDGVSKLEKVQFESRAEAQAENFQKMMLAMVRDIRVILVKLADRIHNMRTLGAMRPDKRRRIARETLEIYVPIAHRLGINAFCQELEELGFKALYPTRFRVLAEAVKRARGNRRAIIERIGKSITERLKQEHLDDVRVIGREKHLYSLYQKMKSKRLSFSEVFDVYAFRIVVPTVDACYRVLGIVHNLYKPVPGKFKDYIAIPKSNGYQSLHTVLFGPYGVPIEVQIRTKDMDEVAEAGIAAHWLYKTGEQPAGRTGIRTREWLRGLLELQKNAGNSLEFIENVKIDLFPDVVYVFTPKGEIKELPRGSTPVDFAYAVHTQVGNTCIAAKIDRRLSPLSSPLLNGQTVEIITAPAARPNPMWLNFVVTGKARANIRHYLKNLEHNEAVVLGRRLLEQSLASFSLSLNKLPAPVIEALLGEFRARDLDALLADIGLGNRVALAVAKRCVAHHEGEAGSRRAGRRRGKIKNVFTRYVPGWLRGGDRSAPAPLAIKGTEGMVVTYAKCCRPIPGDPIVGFASAGRGIVIHVESCRNVVDGRRQPENWIDVQWESEIEREFPVDIRVDVTNERGVLATVAAAIAEMGANIENVDIEDRDGRFSAITLTIDVENRKHLANIMRRVRLIDSVSRISRVRS